MLFFEDRVVEHPISANNVDFLPKLGNISDGLTVFEFDGVKLVFYVLSESVVLKRIVRIFVLHLECADLLDLALNLVDFLSQGNLVERSTFFMVSSCSFLDTFWESY